VVLSLATLSAAAAADVDDVTADVGLCLSSRRLF